MDRELPIRLTVFEPPLGVTFAIQRSKDELLPPSKVSVKSLVFDTRRAKIKTAGINWKLIEQALATPGAVLEVQIEGLAKDGGPCCATVPLVNGGWKVCPTKPSTRRAKTHARDD
jgi:hypothetical protein